MTLALGIVLSMFTSLVISRLLVNALYAVGFKAEVLWQTEKKKRLILWENGKSSSISIILILLAPVGMGILQQKMEKLELQSGLYGWNFHECDF